MPVATYGNDRGTTAAAWPGRGVASTCASAAACSFASSTSDRARRSSRPASGSRCASPAGSRTRRSPARSPRGVREAPPRAVQPRRAADRLLRRRGGRRPRAARRGRPQGGFSVVEALRMGAARVLDMEVEDLQTPGARPRGRGDVRRAALRSDAGRLGPARAPRRALGGGPRRRARPADTVPERVRDGLHRLPADVPQPLLPRAPGPSRRAEVLEQRDRAVDRGASDPRAPAEDRIHDRPESDLDRGPLQRFLAAAGLPPRSASTASISAPAMAPRSPTSSIEGEATPI
jgi:hypothetical protein